MEISRKKSAVFQIWRSFIIFILIPTVLLNIVIFYLLHDMKITARGIVETGMQHAQFLLEQTLRDSQASVESLGNNYQIQKMASLPKTLSPDDYGFLLQVKEQRRGLVNAQEAYSINILCNGSNIFMAGSELCMDLERFYPEPYSFGDIPVEKLKEFGEKGRKKTFYPCLTYRTGSVEQEGILYTTVMTPYADERQGATAIVFLDAKNIQGILGDFDSWDGMTYLMDAEGQILYRTGNESCQPVSFAMNTSLQGVNTLSTEVFGKDNVAYAANIGAALQMVSVIPEKSLYMQMGALKNMIWLLNGTTLIMCFSLALTLAQKRGELLSSTLDLMEHKNNKKENLYMALYNAASSVVNSNTSLRNALGAQKELLQSVFWSRVLSVNTMSDEEIHRMGESAGYSLKAEAYCLLLIGFGNTNEMEDEYWNLILQKRQEVLETVGPDILEWAFMGTHGMDQIVILVPLSGEQAEQYHQYIEEKTGALLQQLEMDAGVFCVGSAPFGKISDISSMYAVCGNQMNLCNSYTENGGIIWCSERELGVESNFYYTDELKNQIILWIKMGQQELVKEGFRRILSDNYLTNHIDYTMEPLLVAKLKLTLLGAYDSKMEINLAEVFEKIDKIQTDAWLFSYIFRVAREMCEYYLANIQSHEDGLQKKILAYIDEHFTEYGFGLASIAAYCKLSETYFSQIFKEMFGENFSSYVEKKRMGYAYQLLVETDMTVDLVSEKTGYSNTNAFRKAYKRFYGVSPSQSRKNNKG